MDSDNIISLDEMENPESVPHLNFMALTAANDAIHIETRKKLGNAIEAKRIAGDFLFNNFTLEETWLPREEYRVLKMTHTGGKLYLSCKAISEGSNKTRSISTVLREYEIILGYQKAGITALDTSEIDILVSFIDQIYEVCRSLKSEIPGEAFQFIRNEALVDENGLAFDFVAMQSRNLFEVYWSAVYLTTLST